MMNVVLTRYVHEQKQTLGGIVVPFRELFVAKTLELGWHNNMPEISCIPDGTYIVKWTRSTRLSKLAGHDVYTYEILGVPGRAGIRIHSANYFFQLLGCIALGSALKDINADGSLDTIHSGDTVRDFNQRMNGQDFTLTIKSLYQTNTIAA